MEEDEEGACTDEVDDVEVMLPKIGGEFAGQDNVVQKVLTAAVKEEGLSGEWRHVRKKSRIRHLCQQRVVESNTRFDCCEV